ncbi:MAG: aminofutalosine synthase MqnE [Bacteroidales bacterium]
MIEFFFDIKNINLPEDLKGIASKIINGTRISEVEGILLFEKAELSFLGMLANKIKEERHGNKIYFNKNIHIEPTNICVNKCNFCNFYKSEEEGYELSENEILNKIKQFDGNITEIHIVGATHPDRDVFYYENILKKIKQILPAIHIKAFSAVELDYMFAKAGIKIEEGLKILKNAGLNSIPGGGAEIFNEIVRKEICSEKINATQWLEIHETAHSQNIPSNATMLYGHIENFENRIEHLSTLRKLQDKTGGFKTFIPLKFRNKNNELMNIKESTITEDLRNYAVSRIFLDNFEHIKAYWPNIGKKIAQLSFAFGVDDVDGTINDTTKIFSDAGAEEKNPAMNVDEIIDFIKQTGRQPIERDSNYNVLKIY